MQLEEECLKGNGPKVFDFLWDEALIVMEKEPEHEFFESLYHKQLRHSAQFNTAIALYE